MSTADEVRYCIRCGTLLSLREMFGKPRPVCPACGWIYFADPKVAVAVLITRNGQVLLGRRVNAPGRGQWTLPAGFIDADEDPREAARRECLEETGLEVEVGSLLDVLFGQEHERGAHILLVFQAQVVGGQLKARMMWMRSIFWVGSPASLGFYNHSKNLAKVAGKDLVILLGYAKI